MLKVILGTGVCGRVWFLQGISRAYSGAGRPQGIPFCYQHINENLPLACLPPISKLQEGDVHFCAKEEMCLCDISVVLPPSCQWRVDGKLSIFI